MLLGELKRVEEMREDESNWFAKWEEELPSPDELMPLSQTLITPDLAIAFDIRNLTSPHHHHHHHLLQQQPPTPPPPAQNTPSSQPNSSGEFDSSELGGTAGGSGAVLGEDEPARTLKRPRLVWTPQLHKRFVDAVAHLGIKNAVPKTIMQLMSVDGLTRENVASHLQKYRLYLKRMQGISNGSGGGGGIGGVGGGSDSDHLFASSPVPAHFLHQGRPNSDHFSPFVQLTAMTAMPHHHQMAGAVGSRHHHHQQQQQYFRHSGTSPPNGQFEQPLLSRQSLSNVQSRNPVLHPYIEDMESATATAKGREVLTLFPAGDD